MNSDLLIKLHRTSIVNSEKLIYTSHFGYVVRFSFLLLFQHKKVDRIILRLCQFEGLHDLETGFSESSAATFRYVTVPTLELS